MLGLGDDRAAAGEDQGEDAEALGGGAAEEIGAGVHGLSSRRRGREDVADGVQRAGDEGEVAAVAAALALDQPRLDQDLEVVADGSLGEAEEGLELADADRLALGARAAC